MARILLLEDDADQLEFRRLLLENAGHQVQTAASVAGALRAAVQADIIVLDLVPGCEEVLATLPQTTRVIVLSGRDAVNDAVAARSALMLRKPCPSRRLIDAIEQLRGEGWTSSSK